MPILDVEMIVAPEDTIPSGVARSIADAVGAVFGADSGAVWIKFRTLPSADYAENGVDVAETPKPVFVRVLKRDLQGTGALRVEATRLAEAIARVCGRPVENVHIHYEPAGAGRVAFGGRLPGG